MDAELKLVARSQQGDHQAFRALVERYEARIYTLACAIVGDRELARDAAQEAFLKAYQALAGFRAKSTFYTWLYRISVNICLDLARKAHRCGEMDSLDRLTRSGEIVPETLFDTERPDGEVEREELRQIIQTVLNTLSPDHRTAIVLKDMEGLSQEEIAETVGCSLGTVKSRLSRARAEMRDALRPVYNEWTGKESA